MSYHDKKTQVQSWTYIAILDFSKAFDVVPVTSQLFGGLYISLVLPCLYKQQANALFWSHTSNFISNSATASSTVHLGSPPRTPAKEDLALWNPRYNTSLDI